MNNSEKYKSIEDMTADTFNLLCNKLISLKYSFIKLDNINKIEKHEINIKVPSTILYEEKLESLSNLIIIANTFYDKGAEKSNITIFKMLDYYFDKIYNPENELIDFHHYREIGRFEKEVGFETEKQAMDYCRNKAKSEEFGITINSFHKQRNLIYAHFSNDFKGPYMQDCGFILKQAIDLIEVAEIVLYVYFKNNFNSEDEIFHTCIKTTVQDFTKLIEGSI